MSGSIYGQEVIEIRFRCPVSEELFMRGLINSHLNKFRQASKSTRELEKRRREKLNSQKTVKRGASKDKIEYTPEVLKYRDGVPKPPVREGASIPDERFIKWPDGLLPDSIYDKHVKSVGEAATLGDLKRAIKDAYKDEKLPVTQKAKFMAMVAMFFPEGWDLLKW